jgi:hypothetical protein
MKLVSLTLNADFGVLKAQEAKFVENPDGLIEIKAGVGQGKTTLKQAGELAISAGNTQKLPFDTEKFKNVDVEIELSSGIFMRTYSDKKGDLKSVAYRKLDDGKIDKDPVINGKKLTPAVLRDLIRTELTFGIDDFLSENPRTHMDFMMGIYSHKLKDLGVVFDKKSPAYENSICWKLEQAKMDRQNKHFARRAINGFKEALIEEGYDEENIPKKLDLEAMEAKKTMFVAEKTKAIQDKIDSIKEKAADQKAVIKSYNDGLQQKEEIRANKLKELKANIEIVERAQLILQMDNVQFWLNENKKLAEKPLQPFQKVPVNESGAPTPESFNESYSVEVDAAIKELLKLGSEIKPLLAQKDETINTEELDLEISIAKANNEIIKRWNAFFDWQESDANVKKLWKEYQSKFAQIDLGVPGLSIQVVGDEESSSIRTHYNGQHNPEFFGNKNKEDRLLTQYSATQRPVIAILMQIYLLSQKDDGLKMMWIECPIDKKTRDLLIDIQKKYDLTIIVGVTGDFTQEGLTPGQFLIENGELLSL